MSLAAVKSVSQAHVTVSAFDVHLWSKPFDPADFNPKIHFLWSSSEYRNMREAGQKVELGNLMLFPLKDELSQIKAKDELGEKARNHFWYRYKVAVDNMPTGPTSLGDMRYFLWPLRCRPKNFKLSFAASKAGVPPKVWATIWLWPFGWSSTVEFKVTAPFSMGDLQALGEKVRAKAPPPFMLDGKALSLSGVFGRLADTVRHEVAIPGKTPADSTRLQRYVFYSLQLPRCMPVPANAAGWSAADQLRMLGTLRGKKVQLGQLLNSEVLFTALGDRNFAVTDFDEGTLLVLRHWKDLPATTRETNHCLFANLRTFSVVYFALHRFIQYAKDRPGIASAMESAKKMLSSLPEEYRNGLALNFKKYYPPPS